MLSQEESRKRFDLLNSDYGYVWPVAKCIGVKNDKRIAKDFKSTKQLKQNSSKPSIKTVEERKITLLNHFKKKYQKIFCKYFVCILDFVVL